MPHHARSASTISLILLAACSSSGGSGTVTVPSIGPGTTVTVTFAGAIPNAAAVSTASGVFVSSSLSGNRLTFLVPAGTNTYAFAVACPAVNVIETLVAETVVEANLSDGTSYNVSPCIAPVPSTASATGTYDISAIPGAVNARIVGAQGFSGEANGVTGAFNVAMPTGANDVAIVALDGAGNPLAVKILRAQTVPGAINGGATIVVSTADEVTNESVTLSGLPRGFTQTVSSEYFTAGGTLIPLANDSPGTYSAISPADTGALDQLHIGASAVNTTINETIGTTLYALTGAPVTLNYPPVWVYTPPAAAKYPTFSYAYNGFSGLATQTYRGGIAWQSNGIMDQITVYATGAFLGTQTSLTIPNLGALAGFFGSAPSGTSVTWSEQIDGGTFPSYIYPGQVPGALSFVSASGTYVEP